MIYFGARGHDVDFDGTPDGLAAALAVQGARCVQFAPGKLFPDLPCGEREINPGYGMMMRRALASRGVDIAVLGCYINMIHQDPVVREALLRRFEAYLRHARYFGAPIVASETGSVIEPLGVYTTDNFTEAAYMEVLSSVRRLVAVGERHHTFVGIEPGRNHPIHDLDTVERLLNDVDSEWLCIVLDPAVLIDGTDYQGEPALVEEAFSRFGDRIHAMHLKDFRPRPDGDELEMTDIGDGVMDVEGILRLVAKHRPYLPVITERTHGDRIGATIRRYGNI